MDLERHKKNVKIFYTFIKVFFWEVEEIVEMAPSYFGMNMKFISMKFYKEDLWDFGLTQTWRH